MIIDRSYFTKAIHIADAQNLNPNAELSGNAYLLDDFILRYEREYLINNLGYSIYKQIEEHLSSVNVQDKIEELIYGKGYIVSDRLCYWRGLVNNGYSPIANYIYIKFLEENSDTYVGQDVVTKEQNNTSNKNYNRKVVNVWRDMHLWTVGEELLPSYLVKSNGVGIDWSKVENSNKSLYQFLTDMNDYDKRYSEWQPNKLLENLNILGI